MLFIKGRCLYSKEFVCFNVLEIDMAHSNGVTYIQKSNNPKMLQKVDFSDATQVYTNTIEFLNNTTNN